MTSRPQERAKETALQTAAFLLICGVMWVLIRPYDGLIHDAQLYALQVLATIQPGIFNGDIFLRFGSQNDFTLFPRFYSLLVRAIGIERAAMFLTLGFSILWLAMGWRIARALSGRNMAWPALGLLISISAWYGAYHVFRSGEMFLSARLPAEVFALAAIAAFLEGRRLLAGVLVLIAGALHPLMGMPVALLLVCMLAEQRWGQRSLKALFPAVILGGTAATLVLSGRDHANSAEWLLALQTRSLFLFPVDWRLADWQNNALILSTIGIACVAASSDTHRRFASSVLMVGISGIGLAAIAGALPQHEFLLKVQPWRWLWPAAVAAIAWLPGTADALWREDSSSLRRTCAILLLASWMLMDTIGGFLALAALCMLGMRERVPPSSMRALRLGAWLVLAAAAVSAFVAGLQCALYPLDTNLDPRWIQRMMNALPTNSTAVAAIFACWLLCRLVARNRLLAGVGIVLAASLLLLVAPHARRIWTQERFSPETYRAFEQWRAIIPETAEVLWPENPTGVWVLLERRSYLSGEQLAGLLYSPRLTVELEARAAALRPLVDPGWWTMASLSDDAAPKKLTADLLAQVCHAPQLDYVVAREEVDGYVAKARFPVERVDVFLYDCHALGKPGTGT